jgi:spore germination protein YaaH
MPNNEIVDPYTGEDTKLIIEATLIDSGLAPKIVDGSVLLPKETILEHIDPHLHWDENLHKLTVTTKNRLVRMKTDSLEAYVNNKPVSINIPVIEDLGTAFVPIEFLSEFYGIEVSYISENNVVIIDFKNSLKQLAQPIEAETAIRSGRSVREPIYKLVSPDPDEPEQLRVFEEYDKWYKVRTQDGILGYVQKEQVLVKFAPLEQGKLPKDESELAKSWKPEKGKINLVWDHITSVNNKHRSRSKIEGLDVISPTWFQVTDIKGNIKNIANADYVDWAHENGYQVWALYSNSLGGADNTGVFLRDTDARDNSIRQILTLASLYNLDGINIDFEGLNNSDKDALTQYVREITPLLREQGLVVSIDINLIKCYDRPALGEIVDYVALMAYDQHWRGGNKAGSVSQVSWAERTLQTFLEDIPKEKLLFGMPFYTRLWEESTGADGELKVTGTAYSMEDAKNVLKENNAEPVWDEESGQYYAEYHKDGKRYRIWLEDVNSINLRTALALKYSVAGVASCRLVQYQHVRISYKCLGNSDSLLISF